jgi:hypothetical protein
MGENVLQGQVKSFKKGADRSLEQMSAPTLFDRPNIASTTYTAAPLDGCEVSEGDQLDAHAATDGQSVLLANGHVSVARIDGDGAKLLVDSLRQPGSSGIIPMKITNVSAVSGFIKVLVARRDGPNGA